MVKKMEVQWLWLFGIITAFQKHSVVLLQKNSPTQYAEIDLHEFNVVNSSYIIGSNI